MFDFPELIILLRLGIFNCLHYDFDRFHTSYKVQIQVKRMLKSSKAM
jgi:hypothetical protein